MKTKPAYTIEEFAKEVIAMNKNFVFNTGTKNADFVVFNPMQILFTDEPATYREVELDKNEFWTHLQSIVWSAGCRFFFVVSGTQIILGNTLNYQAFLCNLSTNVFEVFLKFLENKNKGNHNER